MKYYVELYSMHTLARFFQECWVVPLYFQRLKLLKIFLNTAIKRYLYKWILTFIMVFRNSQHKWFLLISVQTIILLYQVQQLEAEKSQLGSSVQYMEKHHKQELETVEANHQSFISLLEEGTKKRETRIHQDAQESAKRYEDRLQSVIAERSKVVSEHQERMEQVYMERGKDIQKLKQVGSLSLQLLISVFYW